MVWWMPKWGTRLPKRSTCSARSSGAGSIDELGPLHDLLGVGRGSR